MLSEETQLFLISVLGLLATLFIFVVGLFALAAVIVFIVDKSQTKHTLLRNYPVIGHFRYLFEHMGEFMRQYFFAMDREELPFNRAQRSWVYRASKNVNNTVGFGSTRDLRRPGTVLFVSCPFPTLGEDAVPARTVTIGPYCENPYETASLFNISAMSYGALSKPAVLALSNGARMAGCWMNTGEGGLSPAHLEGGADLVVQIGTAKYGVRDEQGQLSDVRLKEVAAHDQVRMFEIKLSQGAKPGKGGILPGIKVTEEIAAIRGIPAFKDSISPNRHTDISSVSDLLDMIARIRRVTGKPVGFKTVISSCDWLDDLFTEVHKRGIESAPDYIAVDSADGGTGAAPMPLMDDMGLSLRETLPMVVDKLCEYGLRERVRVAAAGKLMTPTGAAWALCMGADFVNSARGFMFALGCIQSLKCNRNTCPTGITTHIPKLQKGLVPEDKAVRVMHYVQNLVYEVGMISHACGVREARELSRVHGRMVGGNGLSVPLSELHPDLPSKIVVPLQNVTSNVSGKK